MIVRITNISADQQFIATHYTTLEPSAYIDVVRTLGELDRDVQLKGLVMTSKVTLGFTKEAGDDVAIGYEKMPIYTNITRPLATLFPVGTMIFNSDDAAPNFSDGAQWLSAAGVPT
jgi:hypothetical protein